MSHNFFISHYSGDKSIAELFSNALRRITLEQITPWYSSDTSSGDGLRPGDIWFNQILSKITQSKAVVSLLTPNSIDRPWIYFESGIGQSLPECEVIPVCIGVNRDEILPPLGLYQCYQLNDYRSVVEFFSKLLTLFAIKFDEEMAKVIIEKLVAEISKIAFEKKKKIGGENETFEKLIESFKNHIDKRFLEISDKSNYSIDSAKFNSKKKGAKKQLATDRITNYSVQFDIDLPRFKNKNLFIDIRSNDTFQTLTNTLYFMISEHVDAFTYLEEWIIVEQKTNMHVIIREVAECVPASSIFKPNTRWKIIKLKKPYNAMDSSERV